MKKQNGKKKNLKSPNYKSQKYEAIKSTDARKVVSYSTLSEDSELKQRERQTIISEARDKYRNFPLAGFVLRKHLQSIAYYSFNAATPDEAFNENIRNRVKKWKLRKNCDVSGRFGFDDLIYFIESHRALDGDVGIIRLSNNKIQIIEGDRIRTPVEYNFKEENWRNGVEVGRDGRPLAYSIFTRTNNGIYKFERKIKAENFDLLGFNFRVDQYRGVSLMAPAINMVALLHDSLNFALAKQKLEQIMGLKTTFKDGGALTGIVERESLDGPLSVAEKAREVYDGDIMHFALSEGENAEFLESNNPSQNFQAFCEMIIRMIFASFDIPYSFYDGSVTNYYGSEGEFEQYIDSIEKKQSQTIEMLNEWIFDWLIPNWIMDPTDPLILPRGWSTEYLKKDCGWSGAGLPLWRMYRNVKEITSAICAGLVSPEFVAGEYGFDVRQNLREIKRTKEYAEQFGLFLPYGSEQKTNIGL